MCAAGATSVSLGVPLAFSWYFLALFAGDTDALGDAGAIGVSLGIPLDLFVDAPCVADPLGSRGAIGVSLGLYLSLFE